MNSFKKLTKNLMICLGLKVPSAKDCLKSIKRRMDAVGHDLAVTPGKRVYKTKDANFVFITSDKEKGLLVQHVFGEGRDVSEIYVDYLGKIKSIARSYKKGTVADPDNGVTKYTDIVNFVHKTTPLKTVEYAPKKNKPYFVQVSKDEMGHVLEESRFMSEHKTYKFPVRKPVSNVYLPPLNLL